MIPIFPSWTLFLPVALQLPIENITGNCEESYVIILWASILLTIVVITTYLFRLKYILLKQQKQIKRNFRWLFCLPVYMLVNTAAFIIILGPYLACHGDGQTVLVALFSGPIASLFILALGVLTDVKIALSNRSMIQA
nr:putative membrane protein [Mucilaginibacter sp. FT3.2]